MPDNLTEQEQQLIECLREAARDKEFGLTVTYENGAWEVDLSTDGNKGRGIGRTFAAAWDDVTGLKFG